MQPTRILIAPNAFKHSLSATDAARAIQVGLQQSNLFCVGDCFPIGDGGDGTGQLMIERRNGQRLTATVNDPLGRPVCASFGLVDAGRTAVIEMATASGLHLLKPSELNPLRTTSFGTGQLMKQALDQGADSLVLAIGGSATVDGGTGILRALGVRFLNAQHRELVYPEQLTELTSIDVTQLDPRLQNVTITILCDVDNRLLGPEGSAAVFGPQKGATPETVRRLDAALTTLTNVTRQQLNVDMSTVRHGGAAGGVAAGLFMFTGARLVNGIDYFLAFTHFDDALANAALVITGEGSIDEQTLNGKGPFGVAARARQKGLPVVGLAGRVPLEYNPALGQYFDLLLAIGNGPTDVGSALHDTRQNLVRTARQLGNMLALPSLVHPIT